MGVIRKLDQHVADLIAAGEVCERPASVVKELVENSLDAGAKQITVELEGGGLRLIRVTDDGSGMDEEDAARCFLRHATSKISTEADLAAISTMGFRGEALAAIASVSRVELITREAGSDAGVEITVEGGEPPRLRERGGPKGTTLLVRDLFYNTPARLKFMKRDTAEAAWAGAVVERAAVARPDVAFRLIRDGRELLQTPGDGRLLSVLYCVYGRELANTLVPVQYDYEGVAVAGYLGRPAAGRGNRALQYFSVNERPVKNRVLSVALEEGYKNAITVGRYPVCFVDIALDPALVDVNIHPSKSEVKFVREKAVFDSLYFAVKTMLAQSDGRESLRLPSEGDDGGKEALPPEEESAPAPPPARPDEPFRVAPPRPSERGRLSAFRAIPYDASPSAGQYVLAEPEAPPKIEEGPAFRITGELFGLYIVAEAGDEAYLIDKHAAHERMIYEDLLTNDAESYAQLLLSPVVVNLPGEDVAVLLREADALDSAGFGVEPFGQSSVLVRRVPVGIEREDVAVLLGEIASSLADGRQDKTLSHREKVLRSVACRAAVKAHDKTGRAGLERIAARVLTLNDIKYCPHGRPVAVKLTKKELEKQFKRA